MTAPREDLPEEVEEAIGNYARAVCVDAHLGRLLDPTVEDGAGARLRLAIAKALREAEEAEREACEAACYETATALGFKDAECSSDTGRGAWIAAARIRARGDREKGQP